MTPEELQQIHDDYERWVAHRKFDVSFAAYVTEKKNETKARLYDEYLAGLGADAPENPDSQRPATAHRAVLAGGSV